MTTVETAPSTAPPTRRVPGEEGIWVFVLGDMGIFALFFGTFMYSRARNPDTFALAHAHLHTALGTLNTVLLLTSSLMVAMGVLRVAVDRRQAAARYFTAGTACGAGFVVVKAVEWTQLFRAGIGVGSGEYFSYYFMFTGIHLLHVLIGLAILVRMIVLVRKPTVSDAQRRLCETGGIFWHMVDVLWIVLFAIFYLVR
jgi:nitric oxide reductase NorE protein